jgi:hypothetical protein
VYLGGYEYVCEPKIVLSFSKLSSQNVSKILIGLVQYLKIDPVLAWMKMAPAEEF